MGDAIDIAVHLIGVHDGNPINVDEGLSMRTCLSESSPCDDSRGDGASSDSGVGAGFSEESDQGKRISEVILQVIERRHRGELVSNDEVMAAHPELMPALREELSGLDQIHRAVVLAGNNIDRVSHDPGSTDSPLGAPERAATEDAEADITRLRIQGYLIECEISSGGQATVFRAIQERTGRAVAVKVFHGGPFVGSRGRKRFERESEILARLNHPNIVHIIDRGRTEDGSFFLVMDFIQGTNLDSYVQSLGKNATAIVQIFSNIASAIHEAHQQDVIHRDLKPMNIMVDHRGEPHILDFGMARLLDEFEDAAYDVNRPTLTRTGQVLGSLPWSSPEQAMGQHGAVDVRTDVYALGVMMFHAFAREFPYPVACSPTAAMANITTMSPPAIGPRAQRNGIIVPKGLDGVIQKALAKSKERRYPSAIALADDLEACLAGKPPRIPQRSSRLWWLYLLVASTAVTAAILLAIPGRKVQPSFFLNPEDMRFVRIMRGEATAVMLSGPTDIGEPAATKSISIDHDYYMSATDVTEEQYILVAGHNPGQKYYDKGSPIQQLNLAQALEFCRLLSSRDGRQYRLPTPTEWKYAFYSGQLQPLTPQRLDRVAWYDGNSNHHPHPVGLKLADRWGLFDMLGNVRQWCAEPSGSTSSAVIEGADFQTSAADCLQPSKLEIVCPTSTAQTTIGFRVVCDPAAQE